MSATIEMPVKFEDSNEPSILRDADLIKMFPTMERSIEMANPDWATTGVKLANPMALPFKKATGDFLFQYARKYVAPDQENGDPKVDDYKEANQLTVDELKPILELANFLECTSFMHCVGFVIAHKISDQTIEEVAKHFGVECIAEANMFDEADGWVHPKNDVFEKKQ